MDLHGDALNKIIGDMDDMESKKMYPDNGSAGATITISISPGSSSGESGGDTGLDDLPADHDIGLCGGGCAMHKGGGVSGTSEQLPADLGLAEGGEVLPQLGPDHDALECKGKCPVHKREKGGALGEKGISMADGGMVPATPVPAEVDDLRTPPFLRKKKAV